MQKLSMYLSLAIVLVTSTCGVLSLDETLVKEQECVPPREEKVGLDFNWMGSVEQFYVPLWSKLYSYRVASDLLEKEVEDISETEFSSLASCVLMKKGNLVSGFNRESKFNITPDETSLTFTAPWPGAKTGKFVFHLTDNSTFILGINCWDDNQSGWAVLSTTPVLTEEVKTQVLDYVNSLGFRLDLSVEESFATCPVPPVSIPENFVALAGAKPVQVVPTYRYVLLYPSNINTQFVQTPRYVTYNYPYSSLPLGYHYQWRK